MNPLEMMWNFFGQIGDTVLGGSPVKMAEGGEVWSEEDYVEYLNEVGEMYDYESDEWIIGGEHRWDEFGGKYGEALRKYDPIAFNVGYNEWAQEDNGYAEGGEVNEEEMREKILAILKKTVPKFHYSVSPYKGFAGKYLAIKIYASDYEINRVRGQYPQGVSLSLNLDDMELQPQSYGGMGGQSIYRKPNLDDPSEKYLAMKSVRVPFRRPKPNEKAVLSAIQRFAENYKKTLIENKAELEYQDVVDYDKLLGGEEMAHGGRITSNDAAVESFLTTDREFSVNNITTHYNQYDDQLLLRQYGTLIALRKGNKVRLNSEKYSQTTSTLQNKIRNEVKEKGLQLTEVSPEKMAEGGGVGDEFDRQPQFRHNVPDHVYAYLLQVDSLLVDTPIDVKKESDGAFVITTDSGHVLVIEQDSGDEREREVHSWLESNWDEFDQKGLNERGILLYDKGGKTDKKRDNTMATFELWDYDVWGNEEDGWEVNNRLRTGQQVELDDLMSDTDIVKVLKEKGILKENVRWTDVHMDGEFDNVIQFSDSKTGKPEFELVNVSK